VYGALKRSINRILENFWTTGSLAEKKENVETLFSSYSERGSHWLVNGKKPQKITACFSFQIGVPKP
jgi:hypothetical protein